MVGVFDSGVGGLSILAALRRTLPQSTFVYLYDQAFFPYGLKTPAALIDRLELLTEPVLARFPLDYLVIACNTASTVVLPSLRARLALPVVGVVPAIKPAAELSRSKVIGLLATPATIEAPYTQELIATHAPHCRVVKLGSNRLVELAEAKLRGEPLANAGTEEVRAILAPLINTLELDTVVLGCTHFPHLHAELAAAFPRPITLVEPSEAIARRLASLVLPSSCAREQPPTPTFHPDVLLVTAELLDPRLVQTFGFARQELLAMAAPVIAYYS